MAQHIENSGVRDTIDIVVRDKFGNIKETREVGRKVSQLEKLMLAEANMNLHLTQATLLKGSELEWN